MIIYSSSALAFKEKVDNNELTVEIENAFISKMWMRPSPGERRAWNNSCISWNGSLVDKLQVVVENFNI